MHQHGYRDDRGVDGVATLALVGLLFLTAMRIAGWTQHLRLGQLGSHGAAFLAGHIAIERLAMLLHHIGVSVDAAVWRELQCAKTLLDGMLVSQHEDLGLVERIPTGRANTSLLGIL